MQTHSTTTVLAASSTAPLTLIIVGVVLVLSLIALFIVGQRRSVRRTASQPPTTPGHSPGPSGDQARRGTGWQTPDDDPEQGNPHR
ncbi:hypothetical protein G6045_08575 [Streptomyces sp. YC504]|uniref:Uncharacterized protein n=1 Tax=Streptomyces mesophilus TaxID=1775132 RepID=A0A6G4XFV6_9ACTN|nr:DUF6479 family protein [Streptomyces mesophilus]NGO75730.1 hypothetical protein [Streptomyces mesophilus]